jgi:hypothetical protein
VEETCRAVHTSPIPSHQYPFGLKEVALTPRFGTDDLFCCGLDGGLDSGLTGQFIPYGGYRHSIGERWSQVRQPLISKPAGVSQHAVVKCLLVQASSPPCTVLSKSCQISGRQNSAVAPRAYCTRARFSGSCKAIRRGLI